jgi:hypothetical protein
MIENNMLLIEPTNGEKTRMSIENIQEVLTNEYQKCHRDTSYAMEKTPWIKKEMNIEPLMRSMKVEVTGDVEQVIQKNKLFLRDHQGPTDTKLSVSAEDKELELAALGQLGIN